MDCSDTQHRIWSHEDAKFDHTIKRPNKDTARNLACERRGKTHKAALFLTVPRVPDIKLALKNNTISKATTIVVVNDCPKICASVRKSLGHMGFRSYHVFCGRLENCIDDIAALNVQIDYTFLDFCGGITFVICMMLHNMRNLFAKETRIAMTICAKVRQRAFIDDYESAFDGILHPDVMSIFSTKLATMWVSELVTSAFDTNRAKTRIYGSAIAMSAKNIRRMERANVLSNFVWQVQAVWAALSNAQMSITDSHVYHENKQGASSMGFVQFNLTRTKEDLAKFETVKRVTGINAANKAWTTRRNNATDRSQVAKNAWVTRRQRYGPNGIGA